MGDEEDQQKPPQRPYTPNIIDQFLAGLFTTVSNMSPSSILLSIICAYFFLGSSPNSSSFGTNSYHYREYGYGWGWGYFSVSSMVSFMAIVFFLWQFGTKRGSRKFKWDNVVDEVKNWDFWEVVRFAALFEGAMCFLHSVSRPR